MALPVIKIPAPNFKRRGWGEEYHKPLLFALVFAAAVLVWLQPEWEGADATRYLYWTRSLFFDRDLLLINEFDMLGERLLLTPTGYAHEFHNFGTALFWLPFYAAAYLIDTLILRPAETVRTGYEDIYILLINFAVWFYAGISLVLMYKLARRYSNERVAVAAAAFILWGTSFFYYVAFLPVSSHIISAFLAALFLLIWDNDRRQPQWPRWLGMGVVGGGLLLVANYNLPYLFLPFLSGLYDIYRKGFRGHHLKLAGVYALFGGLTFIPQLFIWWLFFDNPLASPYSDQLSWLDIHKLIFLTWFSGWHGLFVFSPIVFLSLAGIYYLYKQDKILALAVLFVFLGFSYIINANLAWPAGTSFGARYFISLGPILVVSLAVFLYQFRSAAGYIMAAVFSLWTILLYAQTALGRINLHNHYSIGEIMAGQGPALRQLPLLISESLAGSRPLWMIVIGLAVMGGVMLGGGLMAARWLHSRLDNRAFLALPVLVGLLIIFVWYAGLNSQAAQRRLVEQGYYQGKQQIYISDPFDAMKNYHKLADYYLEYDRPERARTIVQTAVQGWPDQTRQLVPEETWPDLPVGYHALNLNFGDVVRLSGYALRKTDEDQFEAVLYWQRLAAEIDEVTYTLRVLDYHTQQVIALAELKEGMIGPGLVGAYPIEHILDGMFFRDRFVLSSQPGGSVSEYETNQAGIKDSAQSFLSGGHFGKIEITMAEAGLPVHLPEEKSLEGATVGFIDLSAAEVWLPVDYNFEHQIALTGYRTYLDMSRQTLTLALRWQAMNPAAKNYKVFTHILDPDQNVIVQRDVEPVSGLRPTSTWQAGEEILDVYDIPLPPDFSSDRATIGLGFYLLETGERLFVVNSEDNLPAAQKNFIQLDIK